MSHISPLYGPVAGGTMVKVEGDYLNADGMTYGVFTEDNYFEVYL